jgi:hypothetical protein
VIQSSDDDSSESRHIIDLQSKILTDLNRLFVSNSKKVFQDLAHLFRLFHNIDSTLAADVASFSNINIGTYRLWLILLGSHWFIPPKYSQRN